MGSTIYFIKDSNTDNFWRDPKVNDFISKGLFESLVEAEFHAIHEKKPLSSPFSIFINDEMVFWLEVFVDTLPSGEKYLRIDGGKYFSPSDLERVNNQQGNDN
jgi:hypothetical protein